MRRIRVPDQVKFWRMGKKRIFLHMVFGSIVFFRILPDIGHQVLLADNIYGLGDSKLTDPASVKCGDHESERKDGNFLGIYNYSAYIASYCIGKDSKLDYYDHFRYRISARPPHTFITNIPEILSNYKAHIKVKLYDIPINKVRKGFTWLQADE